TMSQFTDAGAVRELILLDGQFRALDSMPGFKTAFTYDQTHLIATLNDINTGAKMKMLRYSLDSSGAYVLETNLYDGYGNVSSTDTDSLARCTKGPGCLQ